MPVFKTITTSIGWLAGSLAAISAILGTCGFIVVRSHLYLLGLGDFIQYPTARYIIEGSQFLLYTIIVVNETVLRLVVLLLLAVGTPLFVFVRSKRTAAIRTKWKTQMGIIVEKHAWLFTFSAAIFLFILFFFRLVPYLEDFKKPMEISHLLVSITASEKTSDPYRIEEIKSEYIAGWITHDKKDWLEGYYFNLLLHYLEAGLILFLAWRFSINWPKNMLIRLPFIIIFLSFTLLMPMCYGVLVKPKELSPLTLKWKNAPPGPPTCNLYILQKTADAFIAWDHKERTIVWYPADTVASATIGNPRLLFQSTEDKRGSP